MKRALAATSMLIVGSIAAGCGSSGYSKAPASASSATTPAGSGGGYGYGGYGRTSANTGSASTATAVTVTSKHSKLGTILAAGPKELTVYMFEADTPGKPNCNGACAQVWTPVPASGASTVGGQAIQADLSTITRSDGSKQLAYKGHPLYYYSRDGDKGDAYGEGVKSFGASWYVLAPNGHKIDKS